MRRRSAPAFLRNVVSLGSVHVLTLVLPVATIPYQARVLGADGLGQVAFALAVAQIVLVLSDYGFNLSASKAVAVRRDDPDAVTAIWSAVTFLKGIFVVGAVAVIGLFAAWSHTIRSHLPLLVAAAALPVGHMLYPQWMYQGLERLGAVSGLQALAHLVMFAGVFVFVRNADDLLWATFLQGAGPLLTGVFAAPLTIRLLRRGRLALPTPLALRAQLRAGRDIFLSSAAINLYTTSNTFFMGMLLPPAQVGQYFAAEKIIRAIQSLFAPITSGIYPHVVQLAARDVGSALRFNRKVLLFFVLIGAVFGGVTLVFARDLVVIAFGPGYGPSVPILRVLSVLPLVVGVSNVLGVQTMLPLGMERPFRRILVAAAILNLVIFVPAILVFDALGAAWVCLVVEAFVSVTMAAVLQARGTNPMFAPRPHPIRIGNA